MFLVDGPRGGGWPQAIGSSMGRFRVRFDCVGPLLRWPRVSVDPGRLWGSTSLSPFLHACIALISQTVIDLEVFV